MDEKRRAVERQKMMDPENPDVTLDYYSELSRSTENIPTGNKTIYNPTIERRRIYEIAKAKYMRGLDPFHKAAGLPDAEELEKRFDLYRLKGEEFYHFQKEGVRYLCSRANTCLYDDMGIQPEVQILASLSSPSKGATVWVMPRICIQTNIEHIRNWRPDLVIVCPKNRKSFMMPFNGELVILSWDAMPENFSQKKSDSLSVIFSEIHLAKNPTSLRYKRAMALSAVADRRIGATCVIPSYTEELWTIYSMIYGEELLGPRSRFGRTFFEFKKGVRQPLIPISDEIKEINEMLFLRRRWVDFFPEEEEI